MPRTVFDQTHIAAWMSALDDKPPELPEEALETVPQVVSFRAHLFNVGIMFNMRGRNGEMLAFAMNPVAARHMAASILKQGIEAGWLNEKADVICPAMPLLDS